MNILRALFAPFVGGRMGLGLLVLRVVVGLGIMSHGFGKIQHPTGWMDMKGPSGTPGWMQAVAAASEFFGGLGLLVGALTPIAALGVAATMAGAVLIAHSKLPWLSTQMGAKTWEDAGFYLFSALALMLLGPGRYSVDSVLFGRRSSENSSERDGDRLPARSVRS